MLKNIWSNLKIEMHDVVRIFGHGEKTRAGRIKRDVQHCTCTSEICTNVVGSGIGSLMCSTKIR